MRLRLIALILCCACRPASLGDSDTALRVAPEALSFLAPLGGHATQTVTLEGDGPFSLRTAPPFSVSADELELEPLVPQSCTVTFAPSVEGPAAGELDVLASGTVVARVALGAQAVPCAAAGACEVVTWSGAACVAAPAPDGTSCSSACVLDGACSRGTCLGTFDSCDDADACTADACGAQGCIHTAVQCADADPCQVARCDAKLGCVTDPAPDGTRCGPGECDQAQVCMAGACMQRPAPDGTACGEASLCRAAGTCSAGSCAQPAAAPLPVVWTANIGGVIGFPGLVDAQQNLYWFDCPAAGCAVVSVTSSGQPRFRQPVSLTNIANDYGPPAPSALADGLALVASRGGLVGVSTVDGTLQLDVDFPTRSCGPSQDVADVYGLAADGHGHVLIATEHTWGSGCALQHDLWLVGTADGGVIWHKTRTSASAWPPQAPSVAVDSQGRFYATWMSSAVSSNGSEALALELDGGVRWTTPSAGQLSIGTALGDGLYEFDTNPVESLDTETGATSTVVGFQNWAMTPMLSPPSGLTVLGTDAQTLVLRHQTPSGWSRVALNDFMSSAPWMTRPVLSAQGTVLFAQWTQGVTALEELTPDGAQLAFCPLGSWWVDMGAVTVVLPGLVVMTDIGHASVRAFQWR